MIPYFTAVNKGGARETNETALFTTVCASDRDLCPRLVIDDVVDATHTALTNSFTFEIFGKFEIRRGRARARRPISSTARRGRARSSSP